MLLCKKFILCLLTTLSLTLFSTAPENFKENQKKHPRVQKAYSNKESGILELLNKQSIEISKLRIYLRAFKVESKIELWGKNQNETSFKLLKVYPVCRSSGALGPKRVQGDRQIPEGFYHITAFNPNSRFHLSMAINYPNKSDRILGHKDYPGNNICIHGGCVTIGCLPITNDLIEELYIFCLEAKNNGQEKIPVTIFPAELDRVKYEVLMTKHANDPDKTALWKELKNVLTSLIKQKAFQKFSFLILADIELSLKNT